MSDVEIDGLTVAPCLGIFLLLQATPVICI